jgi:hypothetical protein
MAPTVRCALNFIYIEFPSRLPASCWMDDYLFLFVIYEFFCFLFHFSRLSPVRLCSRHLVRPLTFQDCLLACMVLCACFCSMQYAMCDHAGQSCLLTATVLTSQCRA